MYQLVFIDMFSDHYLIRKINSAGKPLKFSYQEYVLLQRNVEKLQNIITILKSVGRISSQFWNLLIVWYPHH